MLQDELLAEQADRRLRDVPPSEAEAFHTALTDWLALFDRDRDRPSLERIAAQAIRQRIERAKDARVVGVYPAAMKMGLVAGVTATTTAAAIKKASRWITQFLPGHNEYDDTGRRPSYVVQSLQPIPELMEAQTKLKRAEVGKAGGISSGESRRATSVSGGAAVQSAIKAIAED